LGVLLVEAAVLFVDCSVVVSWGKPEGVKQIAMGRNEVRFQLDCAAKRGDGFGKLRLIFQSRAKMVVGFGIIGLEVNRLAVAGGGFVKPALITQRSAQIGVGLSELRLQLNRAAVA